MTMFFRRGTKVPVAQAGVANRHFGTAALVAVGAAIGLTTTIELGIATSWWDEQRVVLLFVLLALLVVGIAVRRLPSSVPPRIAAAVSLVLVLGVLSGLQAPRTFVALVEVANYSLLIGFVLLFAGVPRSSLVAGVVIFVMTIAAPYTFGVAARYVSALLLSAPVGTDTFVVGFSNPRFPAHLQALTIPFLPLALSAARSRPLRLVIALVGALWWMCVFGSGSRTAWIALACASVVAIYVQGAAGDWWRKQLPMALTGLGLYLIGFHLLPTFLGLPTSVEGGRLSQYSSLHARIELWAWSLDAVLANPLLGLGPMHFAFDNNNIAAHPHNFWLQVTAEWGVPAGILVAFTSLLLWARTVQMARKNGRPHGGRGTPDLAGLMDVTVASALTAWLVAIQLDGIMVVPTSQACSAVVLGLSLGLVVPEEHPGASFMKGAVPAAAAILVIAVLGMLPFSDFGRFERREAHWRAANPTGLLLPRFWQQGWIGPNDDPTAQSAAFPSRRSSP